LSEHDPFRDLLVADLALTLDLTRAREVAAALEGYWAAREQVETDLASELHRVAGFSLESLDALLAEVDDLIKEAGGSREAVLSRGGIAATFHTSVSHGLPDAPARPQPELRPWPKGRYEDFRPIGVGGMGMVFLVFDRELDREVALKVVHPGGPIGSADSPLALTPPSETDPGAPEYERRSARFLQEARVTSALEHPGILPIYSVGETPRGVPYYTMRYVRGERTLAEAIRTTDGLTDRLSLLDAFLRVCDTIEYAHSRGVIHRDLKPANIAIGEFGEVMVLDWGLARVVEDGAPATDPASGRALGTPGYLSPEAARGDVGAVDERSDVYSLGATLYEILTRRRPFEFRDLADLQERLVREDPPPADEWEPATPPEMAAICARALSRRPADRFPGAGAVADAVRDYLRTSEIDGRVTAFLEEAAAGLEESEALSGSAQFVGLDRVTSLALQARELRPGDARAVEVLAECDARRERAILNRERRARRSALRRTVLVALLLGTAGLAVIVGIIAAVWPGADPETLSAAEETELREQLAMGDQLCERGRALLDAYRYAEARPVLEDAVRTATDLYARYGDRVDTATLLGRSLHLTGDLGASLGDWNSAVSHTRKAVETLERFGIDERPGTDACTRLALARQDLGLHLFALGRLAEGEALLRAALPLLSGRDRSQCLVRLGRCLWEQTRFGEASEFIDEALSAAIRGAGESPGDAAAAHDHADLLNWAAGLEYVRKNVESALDFYGQSAQEMRSILARNPHRPAFSETLDIALQGIALCRYGQGKWEAALRAYEERLDVWRNARGQDPNHVSTVQGRASGFANVGYVQFRLGRTKLALDHYRKAIPLQRGLVKSCPEHLGWRLSLVEYLIRAANAGRAAGDRTFTDGLLLEADETIRAVMGRKEASTSEFGRLALHLKHRGEFHLFRREHDAALASFQRAYEIRRRLEDRHREDTGRRVELAESLIDLGGAYRAAGEPGTALVHLRKAAPALDRLLKSMKEDVTLRYAAVDCHRRFSDTHRDLEDWPATAVAAREALRHLEVLLDLEPEDSYKLDLQAHLHGNVGNALSRRGCLEEALPELEESVRLRERSLVMKPASAHAHGSLAHQLVLLGDHFVRMGRHVDAVEAYRQAMEAHRQACRLEPSWEETHAAYVRRWRRNALFAGVLTPETFVDHMHLGEIRFERKRWSEALASFEFAMKDPAVRGRLRRPAVLWWAAEAAIMAAAGPVSTEEAAALRMKALRLLGDYVDLLRAEIARLVALAPVDSDGDADRLRMLDMWRAQIAYVRDEDTYLAGIRGDPEFAKIFEE